MYNDIEYYEKLISSSRLFSLDQNAERYAYDTEANKLITNLYYYLLASKENKYKDYSYEIFEVATRCIKNYTPEKGAFLHYFNHSLKEEYSHICGREIIDNKMRGIKISSEEKRAIVNYIRYKEKICKINDSLSDEDMYVSIAEAMGKPVEEIRYIAEMEKVSFVGSDKSENGEDEKTIIFDEIADNKNVETELLSSENVKEIMRAIDEAYDELQERQKPIISDLLTIRLCVEIENIDMVTSFRFINMEIYSLFINSGDLPTQKSVAEKYSRNEASVSRSLKIFFQRVISKLS